MIKLMLVSSTEIILASLLVWRSLSAAVLLEGYSDTFIGIGEILVKLFHEENELNDFTSEFPQKAMTYSLLYMRHQYFYDNNGHVDYDTHYDHAYMYSISKSLHNFQMGRC